MFVNSLRSCSSSKKWLLKVQRSELVISGKATALTFEMFREEINDNQLINNDFVYKNFGNLAFKKMSHFFV